MERDKFKLGLKNFPNGRALGGHGDMRSHMLNLYVPPKTEQLSEFTAVLGSASSSSEEEIDDKGLLGYGLGENPKKRVSLADPKFSGFQVNHDDHQTGSESESDKNLTPVRQRSKRVRKSGNLEHGEFLKMTESVKLSCQTELASLVDTEPVSSISETSADEDVAYCLMMLSRDKWRKEEDFLVHYDDDHENEEDQDQEQDFDEQSENESDREEKAINIKAKKAKGKFRCDTCNKLFKSYQALGGHRASHKKIRLGHNKDSNIHHGNSNASVIHDSDKEVEEKIHECPVCFRVFASGQGLGGHKRTHNGIGMGNNNAGLVHAKPVAKQEEMSLIDLNLPAPMEDEDDKSISAVSDGEFAKTKSINGEFNS